MGIDPGSIRTGYGVVEKIGGGSLKAIAYGVLYTPASRPLPERLHKIHQGLKEVIMAYKPEMVVAESIFLARNVRVALSLGQARGAALLTVAEFGLPLYEYSPLEIKQAAVGYGRADKSQIQAMIGILLGLSGKLPPPDAADALAAAVCHLHSFRLKTQLTTKH